MVISVSGVVCYPLYVDCSGQVVVDCSSQVVVLYAICAILVKLLLYPLHHPRDVRRGGRNIK